MAQYKLYGRRGSGSFAVQVALEEMAAPYERIWVGDSDLTAFSAISPTGKVPALILPDGTAMFESAAILLHLALSNPEADLAPKPGTSQHAKFLQWMVFLSASVYEAVLRVYYPVRYSLCGEDDAASIRGQAVQDLIRHLTLVGQSLNPYILGDRYSVADGYLHMLAAWYPDGRAELHSKVPALAEHAKQLASRRTITVVEADHAA